MQKHLVLLPLFLAFFITLPLSIAQADKILFLTPTRVELDDKDKVEVINVSNLSDIARAYKISFQDLVMTYDGYTTPVDSFEYSAKRMLRFVPRDFVLQPGEKQTVRIMARIPENAVPGEYHTHIRFLEDVTKRDEINPPKEGAEASISAPMAYEALIPAIVKHGDASAVLDITDAKISKTENDNLRIDLVLSRTGNAQGTAFVDTILMGADGAETELTPRRTVYIYREIDERIKDIEFPMPETAAAESKIKLVLYDSNDKKASPLKVLYLDIPQ